MACSRPTPSARSDRTLESFTAWCAEGGDQPMPATSRTVAAFVMAMAEQRAPATVRRYVTSIAAYHRAAGVTNPCDSLLVKRELKRMHRVRGRAQRQAEPISDSVVNRMLRAAGPSLRGMRDKALVVTAYITLVRRSELVALRLEDLKVEPDGFGTLLIRRSKTDQEGEGAIAAVPNDAMRHLLAWIEAAGIKDGPLFRTVRKGSHVGGPLDPTDVSRRFKAMAKAAEMSEAEIAAISGHSTRVGHAQDLMRYGGSMPGIMQAGRWKSPEMVGRYTARVGARNSLVAHVSDRREKF